MVVVLVAEGRDQLGLSEMLSNDLEDSNLATRKSLMSGAKNGLVLLRSEGMSVLGVRVATIVVHVDRILVGGVLSLLGSDEARILSGEGERNISKFGTGNYRKIWFDKATGGRKRDLGLNKERRRRISFEALEKIWIYLPCLTLSTLAAIAYLRVAT